MKAEFRAIAVKCGFIAALFVMPRPVYGKQKLDTGNIAKEIAAYFSARTVQHKSRMLNKAVIYQNVELGKPDKKIHLAYIDLGNAQLEVKFTPCDGRKNPIKWAQNFAMDLVINGNFFPGNPLTPRGLLVGEGKRCPGSISLQQPYIACTRQNRCMIDNDSNRRQSSDIWNAASGAWLVRTGEVFHRFVECTIDGDCDTLNPQTAIGLTKDSNVLVSMVMEGRHEGSSGATRRDMAQLMHLAGTENAILLDGGYSSIMVVDGEAATGQTAGDARAVANVLGFKYQP